MPTHRLACLAIAAMALAACQADPRGEVATGANAPAASAMRCAPYVGETPLSVSGARLVDAAGVEALRAGPRAPVLIDVATGTERRTIPGSTWLPGAGTCDREDRAMQARLEARVAQLTGGDRARPVVVFCPNRNCWLSYNAAIRLSNAGYTEVAWFRDGTDGWSRGGRPLEPVARGW